MPDNSIEILALIQGATLGRSAMGIKGVKPSTSSQKQRCRAIAMEWTQQVAIIITGLAIRQYLGEARKLELAGRSLLTQKNVVQMNRELILILSRVQAHPSHTPTCLLT